jgi:hypothetical protein
MRDRVVGETAILKRRPFRQKSPSAEHLDERIPS